MPRKSPYPNQNPAQSTKKARKAKRKAKSPLSDDTETETSPSGQTGLCVGGMSNTPIIVNKPNGIGNCWTPNPMYYTYDSNTSTMNPQGTPPFMNFTPVAQQNPQQNPFGLIPPPPPLPMSQTVPPAWAAQIIEDIKAIKTSLPRIEHIEKTVNSINLKVSELETKVNKLETKVTEVEASCSFISSESDKQKIELRDAKSEINRLKKIMYLHGRKYHTV